MDPKIVEQLKAANPDADLTILSGGGYEVVVKSPTRDEWRRFKSAAADDRKKMDAAEILLRCCTVFPDSPALDAMLARKPALAEQFGVKLVEMAGMEGEVEKKRL